MLSYSRGALVALLIGLALWFAVVPLRLRGTVALAAACSAPGPLVAWAFSQDGLTTDRAPIAARVDAGHEFGALLLLMVAVLLAAGLAVQFAAAQRSPTPTPAPARRPRGARRARARAGVRLIALAAAPGGVDGQVSKAWNQLTDPNAKTPANTPDRLTATSSVRARYWSEALDIHATEPLLGAGAAMRPSARGSATTRWPCGMRTATSCRRSRTSAGRPRRLFDRGGGVAAGRPARLGLTRRDRGCRTTPSGSGCSRSSSSSCVFGVHSAVDWTWFVRPTPASRCCAQAGWRDAGRCASGSRRPTGRPAP